MESTQPHPSLLQARRQNSSHGLGNGVVTNSKITIYLLLLTYVLYLIYVSTYLFIICLNFIIYLFIYLVLVCDSFLFVFLGYSFPETVEE